MPITKKTVEKKLDASLQTNIRLNNLTIKNYKSIDNLELEFPKPKTRDDLDALVIGSKNGVGKTSILESCSLLIFFAYYDSFIGRDSEFPWSMRRYSQTDIFRDLIKSGHDNSIIRGEFTTQNNENKEEIATISLNITPKGCKVETKGDFQSSKDEAKERRDSNLIDNLEISFRSILGHNSEIFYANPLLYFHSYRKVREGDLELSSVVENSKRNSNRYEREAISLFKNKSLLALLSNSNLIVGLDRETGKKNLTILNRLLLKYANASLEDTLEPTIFNSLKIRIKPKDGDPFPIDGLSSGQKEILQTLFLIWHYSNTYSPLILIDEPELHLNSEWHGSLIKDFKELAPRNQYIIATHSDSVFNSFEPYQRVIIG